MRQTRRAARPYTPYSGVRRLLPASRPPAGRPGGAARADPEPARAEVAPAQPEASRGPALRPGDPCPRSDQGLGWGKCWRCDLYPLPGGCAPRISLADRERGRKPWG